MKNVHVGKSNIHGRGLFTTDSLNEGDIIGVSLVTYERVCIILTNVMEK